MSILFCKKCDKNVDTDHDAEHFTENEECIKWLWDNQEITVNKSEYIELKAVHDKLLLIYAKQTYRMDKLKASHERLKKACLIVKEFDNVDVYSEEWETLADKHMKLNDEALKQAL